jgi:hypothetical protein
MSSTKRAPDSTQSPNGVLPSVQTAPRIEAGKNYCARLLNKPGLRRLLALPQYVELRKIS